MNLNSYTLTNKSGSLSGLQHTIISRYLDDVGDGSGSKNANGNYSAAEEIFFCQPPAGQVFRISRIIISVEDGQGFRAERYGALGAALSNGITLRSSDDNGMLVDFTNGIPITTNAEWGNLCFDVQLKSWGAGDELLLVRYTLTQSGQFLRLDGDRNQRIEAVFNDDLSGLVSHKFIIQGFRER